jgi:hypothetical protein
MDPSFDFTSLTMNFTETLRQLPPVTHLEAIEFLNAAGEVVDSVENRPGKTGSLTVYAALAKKYNGALTAEAANEGLALFAEHTADARANPGKHANIDRLLRILASGEVLRMRVIAKQPE